MADGVRNSGVHCKDIAVIPNSCDIDDFQGYVRPAVETRASYRLPADGHIVSYTGTIGEINGVDYLCHLASAMQHVDPRVVFLIVGDGKDRARVRRVASETGLLNSRVFFVDPVDEVVERLVAESVYTFDPRVVALIRPATRLLGWPAYPELL